MADPVIRRCRIPELLAANNKKQVDLATYLKVSEAHISKVINLKGSLSLIKLKKTARFLNCSLDDIFEWDD